MYRVAKNFKMLVVNIQTGISRTMTTENFMKLKPCDLYRVSDDCICLRLGKNEVAVVNKMYVTEC